MTRVSFLRDTTCQTGLGGFETIEARSRIQNRWFLNTERCLNILLEEF